MNWIKRNLAPVLILTFLSLLIFTPFLGHVSLFDTSEVYYAESAREMIETDNYTVIQINYKPLWNKQPLFIWMQALSMKLFDVSEFSARLPNTFAAIFTLIAIFFIGRRLYDQKFAILWCLTFIGSILPVIYFKSALIDPWYNLFIFLTVINYGQLYYTKNTVNKNNKIFLSALFMGLAILTKGPFSLGIIFLVALVLFFLNRFKIPVNFIQSLIFILTVLIIGSSWIIFQYFSGNNTILHDYLVSQKQLFNALFVAKSNHMLHYWVALLFGLFPAAIYALRGFSSIQSNSMNQIIFKQTLIILLIVVLLLFALFRSSGLHLVSILYFPVTFLGAYAAYQMGNNRFRNRKWIAVLITFMGILIAASIILPSITENKPSFFSSEILNKILPGENRHVALNWTHSEWLTGVWLLVGLLFYNLIRAWNYTLAYWCIHVFTLGFTLFALYTITPKVEQYAQQTAIDFYKKKSHEDCYVTTIGFRSYAHLFYSRKKPPENPMALEKSWLLTGDVDKPVYVVTLADKKKILRKRFPTLIILFEENGYLFCKRN